MASQTLISQAEKMYKSELDTTDYAKLLTQPAVDVMKGNLEKQQLKLEALIATTPAGVNISKVPEELRGKVTEYLTKNKADYVEASKVIASGIKPTDQRYIDAVETMNRIRGGFEALDANLVKLAENRKLSLDSIDSISPGASTHSSILHHKFANGEIYKELTLEDGNFYYTDHQGNKVNTNDYIGAIQQTVGITDGLDPIHTAAITDKRKNEKFKVDWYRGKVRTLLKKAGKNGRIDFAYSGMAGDDSGQTEFIDKYITEKHGITRDSDPGEFEKLYQSYKEADFSAGTELGRRLENYLLNTIQSSYNDAKVTTSSSDGGGGKTKTTWDTSYGNPSKVRANNYMNKIKNKAKTVTDLRGNSWTLQKDGTYKADADPSVIRTRTQMIELMEMDAYYPNIYKNTLEDTNPELFDPKVDKGEDENLDPSDPMKTDQRPFPDILDVIPIA